MKFPIFLILVLCGFTLTVFASTTSYQNCIKLQSHTCFVKLNQELDSKLQLQYHNLLQNMPKSYQSQLTSYQKIWQQYREAAVNFSNLQSASMQPLLRDQTYAELTLSRIKQFNQYLSEWH